MSTPANIGKNWVDVTPEQVLQAETWWNHRSPTARLADWPRMMYAGGGFFPCAWRVFSGRERADIALTLMEAGLIDKDARDHARLGR